MDILHRPQSGTAGAPLRLKSSTPRSGFVQQNHWSEQPPRFAVRESRASATRSGCRESRALSRRGGCRSVLAFGGATKGQACTRLPKPLSFG